jgi:hypothetical protein
VVEDLWFVRVFVVLCYVALCCVALRCVVLCFVLSRYPRTRNTGASHTVLCSFVRFDLKANYSVQ